MTSTIIQDICIKVSRNNACRIKQVATVSKNDIITAKKKGLAVISEKLSIAGKTYRTVDHVQ